jgi:6-pyruvoyltetrahydropterin/6-carboxytetrahydropterin synthase
MRVSLTRTLRFHASHRYWKAEWTPEQNRAHFGSVADDHPHDYTCTVTVTGPVDPELSGVMDLAELDRLLEQEIRERFAGKTLHLEVPEFGPGQELPTCEAIARLIFTRLEPRLAPPVELEAVTIAEDDTLRATVSR